MFYYTYLIELKAEEERMKFGNTQSTYLFIDVRQETSRSFPELIYTRIYNDSWNTVSVILPLGYLYLILHQQVTVNCSLTGGAHPNTCWQPDAFRVPVSCLDKVPPCSVLQRPQQGNSIRTVFKGTVDHVGAHMIMLIVLQQ